MTITTRQKATSKKVVKSPRKNPAKARTLRVRPEPLPTTATYGTFDSLEYVMIPVSDFDSWYEAIGDRVVWDYATDADEAKQDPDMIAKLLKTRKKYLPDSSKKITIDKEEYIAAPVVDIQEWLEDIENIAVCRYVDENPEPCVPFEEVVQKLGIALPKRSPRRL